MEAQLAAAQADAHDATQRLRAGRDTHIQAHEADDTAARAVRTAAEAHEGATRQVERASARIVELEREAAQLREEQPAASTAATTSDELDRLQRAADAARERRETAAAARDAARARWAETRGAAETMETRVADRRRERTLAEARVAQLEASLPRRMAERDTLDTERAALADELRQARQAHDAATATHADAEGARSARRGELLELERAQGGAGGRLGELERAAQATAIEASRRDEVLASLGRERELALEGLPELAAEVPPAEIEPLTDEELEAELRRVRRMLSQIGSVNPFAVEEHRELSERLTEMSTQEADLRGAIGSTEELIARLDAEIAEQFDSAFRAIAERFDEFCQLLFAGGSGSLQMADEADGDAPGGIEIVVRPPGKRLQRLAMLSGGERALTGVALLFAMLTVNPVPFCILDEVDAALDEANIGRFADALRKLSESIDFVVITHNRATIEVADTIYGVTMTDAAVSRVLSLRLADLPAEVSA
jgi:chromosome segregation protein